MDKNMEILLDGFRSNYNELLPDFAENFDEEKYRLILKLRNHEPFTNGEWDVVLGKYRKDIEMARTLITTPYVYSHIKSQVVEDFLNDEIEIYSSDIKAHFVEEVLVNCDLSETTIDDLFYKEHNLTARALSSCGFDNGISHNIAKQIMQLELFVIGERIAKPSNCRPEYGIFTEINSNELLDVVLNNMPANLGKAEKIATALINSKYISDENKNKIFEQHGCHCHDLKLSTPEMIEQLYMSFIETAIPDDRKVVDKSREEFMLMCRAQSFIEGAIEHGLLSESLEYDLVNRLIEDAKKYGDKKMNNLIGLIIEKTTSPKVLHLIFKSAVHANDRDAACTNPNASNDDILEQANEYCKKINKKLVKEQDIADKWIFVVADMSMRARLSDKNYQIMLDTRNISIMDSLISSLYTPEDVFKKAQKIVDKKVEEGKQRWRSTQVKSYTKDVLTEYGMLDKTNLDAIGSTASSLILQFDREQPLRNIIIASDFYRKRPDLAEHVRDMCIKIAERIKFRKGTHEDFVKELDDYFKFKERDLIDKDWSIEPAKNMTRMQIKRAKNDINHSFSKLLASNVGQAYEKLESIAQRYSELYNEEKLREEKEKEWHGEK